MLRWFRGAMFAQMRPDLVQKPIAVFYDLRAFMRSPTSR
jgi:hypothetical protein